VDDHFDDLSFKREQRGFEKIFKVVLKIHGRIDRIRLG
jgi:hypothetical protein